MVNISPAHGRGRGSIVQVPLPTAILSQSFPEPGPLWKLFIRGLSFQTTSESLRSHSEPWGMLSDCGVVRSKYQAPHRLWVCHLRRYGGGGSHERKAHEGDGRVTGPKTTVPREGSQRLAAYSTVKNISVGGIKDDTEEHRRRLFQHYGKTE